MVGAGCCGCGFTGWDGVIRGCGGAKVRVAVEFWTGAAGREFHHGVGCGAGVEGGAALFSASTAGAGTSGAGRFGGAYRVGVVVVGNGLRLFGPGVVGVEPRMMSGAVVRFAVVGAGLRFDAPMPLRTIGAVGARPGLSAGAGVSG